MFFKGTGRKLDMNAPLKTLIAPTTTLALVLTITNPESAQALTFYSGLDAGAGPGDLRPSSDTAANTFDTAAAALGTLNTITFEGVPLTTVQTLTIAPGVTASWFNQADFTIFNNPSPLLGYNTTPGGSQFARVAFSNSAQPVGVTFSFATPVQAWGAYFTGVGTASGSTVIQFSDGTIQAQSVLGALGGGVSFLGFTDPNRQISSITVLQTPTSIIDGTPPAAGDIFGIDDIRYVSSIPTPALLPGLMGVGVAVLRRKFKVKN